MENIDKKLIETINEKVAKINEKLETFTTEEQIESIVKNIAKSHIESFILQQAQDIMLTKIKKHVDEVFNSIVSEEDLRQSVRRDLKEFIFSHQFHSQIKSRFEKMIDDALHYSPYD